MSKSFLEADQSFSDSITAMNRMQHECNITHDEKDSSPNMATEIIRQEFIRVTNGFNSL